MATLTICAHPAFTRSYMPGAVCIEITKNLVRERVEITSIAQAKAEVRRVATALETKQANGWQVDGFIFDGDGRKPNGFEKARKARELTVSKPAPKDDL